MILDDDPQILKMTSFVLIQSGYQVITGENGKRAVSIINQERPQLLLTDILMPEIDGIEVINACRKERLDVKVIAMSGGRRKITAEFNLKSAEMLGASAILEKPFTNDQLLSCIKNVLQRGCSLSSYCS